MKTDFLMGQFEIPEVGFIQPDGSFINVKDYGCNSHIDFAEKVMESINESGYGNMLKFAEQGYIRFRKDMGEAIIQASSYPTNQQFMSIRKSVDNMGKGLFEVFKNKVPEGYIEMTRDTLDADMRKLEALLNKVKPPQPKIH